MSDNVLIGLAMFVGLMVYTVVVGYLRTKFRGAYNDGNTPWFLAIWLWPFAGLIGVFYLAKLCLNFGHRLAKPDRSIPKAQVHDE